MHGGKRYESSALISALLSVSTSRSGGHTRAPWNTASGPRPGSIRGPSHRHGTSSGQTHPVLHRLRGTGRRGGCTACSGTSGWLEQRRDSGVVERRDLDKDFLFIFSLLFLAGAGRSECFSTWVKPGARKGMCLDSSLLFVVAAGLPSILPPTHRLSTPPQLFSSGKKNLVFTPAARVRLQPGERIQGCGAAGRRRALLLTRCNSRQQTLS